MRDINTLAALIEKYQESYYSGEAEISDAEFDMLWDELKNLSPDHPILNRLGKDSVDGFPKALHIIPMGSQEKAAGPAEFRAWANKIKPVSYVVQYKLDGASLELQYDRGKLKAAVTRGDGEKGDNITANALLMSGTVQNIVKDFTGGVRGEVIMTHDTWELKYSDKANCRNAANGIMRRKDGSGCDDLVLICYDAASLEDDSFFKNEIEKIDWLKKQGFNTSETRVFNDPEDVINFREDVSDKRRTINYDIDGLVVKDFITDMNDLRRPRPERQIAFKFEPEAAYTILKEIIWSETGSTYTPIGVIEPVRLAGTTVKRANLNNPDMIRNMGLKIGSMVKVVKRGDIIPKIEGLAPEGLAGTTVTETKEIEFPEKCETCKTLLEDSGTRLFCPNPDCSKKILHRLEKWVSVLDIRELGDKLLVQLFNSGRVKSIPDLYTLTEDELSSLDRMGKLSSAKVIRHINTKRQLSLSVFLAGFNIEGIGELIFEKALSSGFDTLEKIRSSSTEELAAIHGLGEITAGIIYQGLRDLKDEMNNVLAQGIISIQEPLKGADNLLKGVSFCFTGELQKMKRSQAEEKVKMHGGQVKSSVTKDLDYLVTNFPESNSSKNKKARELKVKIIDENSFLEIIAQGKVKSQKEVVLKQKDLF